MRKTIIFTLVLLMLVSSIGVFSACGEKEEGHKHSWDDGVVTIEARCDRQGEKVYTCSCGETETKILEKTDEHIWISAVAVGGGYIEGSTVCSICGAKPE